MNEEVKEETRENKINEGSDEKIINNESARREERRERGGEQSRRRQGKRKRRSRPCSSSGNKVRGHEAIPWGHQTSREHSTKK